MIKLLLSFFGFGGMRVYGAVLIAAAVAGAFAGGLWTQRQFHLAAQAKAYVQHNEALRQAVQRTIDQALQLRLDDDAVIAAAFEAREQAVTSYVAAIRGLKDAEPTECTDRPFPDERRRLLNLARTGQADPPGGVPDAAGPSAQEAAHAALPFTYEDEQLAHAGCGRAYRELIGNYNALIDWHEKQAVTETTE